MRNLHVRPTLIHEMPQTGHIQRFHAVLRSQGTRTRGSFDERPERPRTPERLKDTLAPRADDFKVCSAAAATYADETQPKVGRGWRWVGLLCQGQRA